MEENHYGPVTGIAHILFRKYENKMDVIIHPLADYRRILPIE